MPTGPSLSHQSNAGNASTAHPTAPPPTNPGATQKTKGRVWKGLERALQALHISAETLPPLQSAVDGLVSCLDTVEAAARNRHDYDELATNLSAVSGLLEERLQDPRSAQLNSKISTIANAAHSEVKHIQERQRQTRSQQALRASDNEDDIIRRSRRIVFLFHRIQVEAGMSAWSMANDHLANTRLENMEPAKLASFNSKLALTISRRTCTNCTREEVLSELDTWSDDPQGKTIYWMNGMAGTGKTTIACTFATTLESRGQLGASFFCTRSSPECRDADKIIPTIAYQLARYSTPFQSALCRVLNEDPDVSSRSISSQFERLLREPLMEVKDKLSRNLVIVIDALDECDSDQVVGLMLDMLFRYTQSLPIKFFVTSRPEAMVYNKMMEEGVGTRTVKHLHEIERSVVQADIELYLQEELKFISPSQGEIKKLAELSDNLFIYAATAVRYIRPGKVAADPRERLITMLTVDSKSTQKYSAIDALYSAILAVTFTDKELDPREIERAKLVLWTTVCAQEPVTIQTLEALTGITTESQVQAALQSLRSVLHVSEHSSLVSTLHASFPQYIFNQERSNIFFCNRLTHNGHLASNCFRLMREELRFNICRLESSFVPDSSVMNLDKRVALHISPALSYVCRYWAEHLSLSLASDWLFSGLREFLLQRLLFWMEVLNLNRCLDIGAIGLMKVQTWMAASNSPLYFRQFISDVHKFVASFVASPISLSTPHIYVSALPFSPKPSLVLKHYQAQFQGLLGVKGTAMIAREGAAVARWSFDFEIHSAVYSPDGTLIALGSSDSAIRICNAHNGALVVGPMEGHTNIVSSVRFSPDGAWIVSGSHDCTLRFWSLLDGTTIGAPLLGHTGGVKAVGVSPDNTRVVSGSLDHTIRIWTREGSLAIGPIRGYSDSVESVEFSPDGACIVSGSRDRTISIHSAYDGSLLASLDRGHIDPILSVSFSPTGRHIVSGCDDSGIVCVWNADDLTLAAGPFQRGIAAVKSVRFSPDGAYIASGSSEGTVHVWRLHDGALFAGPFDGHDKSISEVHFSPDGIHIISSSEDCTMSVWNSHESVDHSALQSIEGHTDFVSSVGFSPDGARIVSGCNDGTICIWRATDGNLLVGPIQGHTWTASSLGISLSRAHLDSGSDEYSDNASDPCDCPICAWNASVHDEQHVVNPYESFSEPITSVGFSPDGNRILSGSYDGTIYVWDAYSGKKVLGPFEGHDDWVTSAMFSFNGKLIVSGSSDHTIGIWDAHEGVLALDLVKGHTDWVTSVKFSPNDTQVVSGSRDHSVCVWNVSDGALAVGPIRCGSASVDSVGFSPDGMRIVSGCSDNTIYIWNAADGNLVVGPFEGHSEPVTSVAFSSDGSRILSGSKDATIRLWDASDGRPAMSSLEGHTGGVEAVQFSPDCTRIVSGSIDGTIRVWQIHDNPPEDETLPAEVWLAGSSPDQTYVVSGSGGCTIHCSSTQAICTTQTTRIVRWSVRDDGWFINKNLELLFWVPPELRSQFPTTSNLVTIGDQGSLEVDFRSMLLGDRWQECYIGV